MTSRDFCYWLQGFFELHNAGLPNNQKSGLTLAQTEIVRAHLNMVFAHEIDPSFAAQMEELREIHSPSASPLPSVGLDNLKLTC